MDHATNINEVGLVDGISHSWQDGEDCSVAADTEPVDADFDKACEIERLSREAGIDPSSLTDVQIMEALYQMG